MSRVFIIKRSFWITSKCKKLSNDFCLHPLKKWFYHTPPFFLKDSIQIWRKNRRWRGTGSQVNFSNWHQQDTSNQTQPNRLQKTKQENSKRFVKYNTHLLKKTECLKVAKVQLTKRGIFPFQFALPGSSCYHSRNIQAWQHQQECH